MIEDQLIKETLVKLKNYNDGYVMGLRIDEIDKQEDCNELKDILVRLGCLKNARVSGHNYIFGEKDDNNIDAAIRKLDKGEG